MLTRSISERRAAAIFSAAIFGTTAAIELARVWYGTHMLIADELLGIAAALLFSITATALVTNEEESGSFVLVATFALLAHGGTLAITMSPFGVMYLGSAPVLAALAQVMRGKARLGLGRVWRTARAAAPVVSRNPHATPA